MPHEAFTQPREFLEESESLFELLAARPDSDLALVTQYIMYQVAEP